MDWVPTQFQALWSETAIVGLLWLHNVNQSDKSTHIYDVCVCVYKMNIYLFIPSVLFASAPWLEQVAMHL